MNRSIENTKISFGKDQFIPHFLLGNAALDVEQEVTRVTGSGAQ